MTKNIVTDKGNREVIRVLNRSEAVLYEYWVNTYSNELLSKWFKEHMYEENTFRSIEFITYLSDNFHRWLSRNG